MDLVLVNIFGSQTGAGLAYAIVIVQLLLFLALGLNQWLLHRAARQVEWLRVREKAHLVLSLSAKSLLSWQIFGGSLAGPRTGTVPTLGVAPEQMPD